MTDNEPLKTALLHVEQLTLELAAEKIFTDLAFQLLVQLSAQALPALERLAEGHLDTQDADAQRLAHLVRARSKLILANLSGDPREAFN